MGRFLVLLFVLLPLNIFASFDVELLDYPFVQSDYPSMSEAVKTAEAFHELIYLGLDKVFPKYRSGWMSFLYGSVAGFAEVLYMYLPGGSGWLHEEFHRAVLTHNGVSSFDEVYEFPLFRSVIQVKRVKDADLEHLKSRSPQDWVRLQSAGIEGESLLIRQLRQRYFFEDNNRNNVLIFIETLNPLLYLWTCTQTSSDSEIDAMNLVQTNVEERDFTGYDFTAWVYDLFRPNEPYTNRGEHITGTGVDRYIRVGDLSGEELNYLKDMVWLNLVNLIAPSSFGIRAFRFEGKKTHLDLNFDFAHYLAPFGFAVDLNVYLKWDDQRWFLIVRNQVNRRHWFPALEVTDFRIPLNVGKFHLFLTPALGLWMQPENLLFEDDAGMAGGLFSLRCDVFWLDFVNPYVEIATKTRGWVPGWVSLNEEARVSAGLNWKLR